MAVNIEWSLKQLLWFRVEGQEWSEQLPVWDVGSTWIAN